MTAHQITLLILWFMFPNLRILVLKLFTLFQIDSNTSQSQNHYIVRILKNLWKKLILWHTLTFIILNFYSDQTRKLLAWIKKPLRLKLWVFEYYLLKVIIHFAWLYRSKECVQINVNEYFVNQCILS